MIRAVDKCLRILELISEAGDRAVKLSEIAASLSEHPSTCAGIILTMTERGYLKKDPVRGYRLGMMAAALAHGHLYRRDLLQSAEARLRPVAIRHSLYLALAMLHDNVRHSILEVDETGAVIVQVSANAAMMNSSTGLVLAAHQPRRKQDELLEFYGIPRRFGGYEEFIRYLDLIKEQGFAEIVRPPDRSATAVPVWAGGRAFAAVGVYMTQKRRDEWSSLELADMLRCVAAEIGADLGDNVF